MLCSMQIIWFCASRAETACLTPPLDNKEADLRTGGELDPDLVAVVQDDGVAALRSPSHGQ
jgi:hypothetical protein